MNMTTNEDILRRELTTTTPMRWPHLRIKSKRALMKWVKYYVGYWQDLFLNPNYVHVLRPKPRSKPVKPIRSNNCVQLSLFDFKDDFED